MTESRHQFRIKKFAAASVVALVLFGLFSSPLYASSFFSAPNKAHRKQTVAGRLLVQYKRTTPAGVRATGHRALALGASSQARVEMVPLAPDETPELAVQKLLAQQGNDIDFAEVDRRVPPDFIPNDPGYSSEWHHPLMNSPIAWDTTRGSGIVIAIADSGVDGTHPDLAGRLVAGWNFYDNNANTSDVYGHGTAVAGAAAAAGNNARGVAGVAWEAQIMPLRISDSGGWATYSAAAQAIYWAADHGAKVLNLSFQMGDSLSVQSAASYFRSRGGVVTISAGNYGEDTGGTNSGSVLVIGATDNRDNRTIWSNYGIQTDLVAPGAGIVTTTQGGGTSAWSGTSFSAPLTAGVLALVYAVKPTFTAQEAESILFDSAVDLGPAGWDAQYGWGRIDAGEAVNLAVAVKNGTGYPPPTITQQPGNITVVETDRAQFSIGASGRGISFQWQRASAGASMFTDVAGVIGRTFTLDSVALTDNGTRIRCTVTNNNGHATSAEALLSVTKMPPPRLIGFVSLNSVEKTNDKILIEAEHASRFTWSVVFLEDLQPNPAGRHGSASPVSRSLDTTTLALDLSSLSLVPGRYSVHVVAYNSLGEVSSPIEGEISLVAPDLSMIRVFPNPWRSDRHGALPITFDHLSTGSSVKIFTIAGQSVRELALADNAATWDLKTSSGDSVASGIYIYLISDAQGQKTHGKFAVIH